MKQHTVTTGAKKRGIATHLGALAAALFCGAVITQAYFEGDTDSASVPAPETAISLDAASVVGVLNSAFTADGVRNKPRYPMEFETVLGPTTLKSFDRFASAAWPDHNATTILASTAPRTQPNRKVAAVAPVCAGSACRVRVAAAEPRVLPPARPAYLMPASVVVAEAQPRIPVQMALAEDRRVRLLGLTLPGFVPTGDRIVKTVVSWSGTVADFVPRI